MSHGHSAFRRALLQQWVCVVFALFSLPVATAADTTNVGFRDDFESLENWRHYAFENIKSHTNYSIENLPEGGVGLKAENLSSASALISLHSFNAYETPILEWRWRVTNVYEKGDATRKDGDDYPLRLYVLFHYDPERATTVQRLKYAIARKLHGEYLPDSILNYIWASRSHSERVLVSPYTDRSRMVVMRSGTSEVGQWLDERVNILEDYRRAFSSDPPDRATLALMSDSDNTGESAVAYLDYVELLQKEASSSGEHASEER